MLRILLPILPHEAARFAPWMILMAVIGVVYGALVAMAQWDLKKLIAYSSVNHMGYFMMGVAAACAVQPDPQTQKAVQTALSGAIYQMFAHGIITGALFILVGVIYERTHDRTIAKMGGLAALTPVYAAVFGFFVFASAGLPALSGFVGEFLTLVGSFVANPWVAGVATLVMILAAVYLLWMFQRVVLTEPSPFLLGLGHHLTDMTPTEILTLAPLGALVVVFGLFPGILLDLFKAPVSSALASANAGTAIVVDPLWVALGLGFVVAVVVARLLALRPGATSGDEQGSALTPVEGAAS
jgi:NADH-quinone oxidoreductase subunit M